MCTYCGTTNYRKIYENHVGPIPQLKDGRTYDIHHIDGKHNNNDPSNLKAVTLQEHYEIHYLNGEYNSCKMIKLRMDYTLEEIRELGRKGSIGRVSAIDKSGNKIKVGVNDPRLLSGELTGVTKGFTPAKDKDGNMFHVSIYDPRYVSGELVHPNHGTIPNWCGKKKTCLECGGVFDYGNYAKSHGNKCNVKNRIKPKFERITSSRKIIVDNIIYKSISEASRILGIKIATVYARVNSNTFTNYQYYL